MTRVVGVDSAPPHPVLSIRRVNRLSSNELDELTALLVSCVAQGASLGFLAPLAVDAARDWWAGGPARRGNSVPRRAKRPHRGDRTAPARRERERRAPGRDRQAV